MITNIIINVIVKFNLNIYFILFILKKKYIK